MAMNGELFMFACALAITIICPVWALIEFCFSIADRRREKKRG